MAKWVCSYCVATKGLNGSELDQWPDQGDDDAIAAHIESEHHIPVRGSNETREQAMKRVKRAHPEAGGPNCRCPSCSHGIRGWLIDAVRAQVHGEAR